MTGIKIDILQDEIKIIVEALELFDNRHPIPLTKHIACIKRHIDEYEEIIEADGDEEESDEVSDAIIDTKSAELTTDRC